MPRLDEMAAALVREAETFLSDQNADEAAARIAVVEWLHVAPCEEIRRLRGYVKPNPRNDVAMFEDGRAHSRCPIDCEGCTCFCAPPCSHCVEHEPAAACGCPFYTLEDTGEHGPECRRPAQGGA
jgi:hypothetical protein